MKRTSRASRGLVIALTGGIACGKSTVGRFMEAQGAALLDTDEVAHALLNRGAVSDQVIGRFGQGILGPDGVIDRAKLGRLIFGDDEARRALNELTHPAVMAEVRRWLKEATGAGRDAVVIIPLLFEIGATDGWNAIVCVVADEWIALERMLSRGLAEPDARRRMAAQWPVAEKAKHSDFVITNNTDLRTLESETAEVYRKIREKEKKAHV
ncbi:MAG: dephospho-CoA kinase [bacterium]